MHFKLNPSKFNFIFLGPNLSPPLTLSLRSLTLPFIPPTLFEIFVFFLIIPFLLNLKFSPLLLLIFIIYLASDRFLLISMMPLLKFLSTLVLSRFEYCNFLYYNLSKSSIYFFTKAFNSVAHLVFHTP